jgi:hypothetical protein
MNVGRACRRNEAITLGTERLDPLHKDRAVIRPLNAPIPRKMERTERFPSSPKSEEHRQALPLGAWLVNHSHLALAVCALFF